MASGMRCEFEGGAEAADPAGSVARVPVAPRPDNRSDRFSWRLAAFYAAFFGFSEIIMPFFPAWLQAKGLDSRATGIVLAVPMFIRLISVPSLARLADRRNAFRGALISTAFGSASAYVLLSQVSGFVPIVLAAALAALATAPTMPLLDAYALRGLALRGRAYGPVRLWGSVAFVFANFGAGFVIDRIAPIQIIWLLFGSLVVVAAVSLTLQPIASDGGSAEKVGAAAGKLLLSPGFWVFTSGASLIQASHAVYYGFSVLDWRAKGLDAASIGGLWGLAVIAEIALFAVSARFPQRIGSLGLTRGRRLRRHAAVGSHELQPAAGAAADAPVAARVFVRRHPPRINAAPGAPCARPAIRHSPGRLCHAAGASHGGRHGALRCALCRPRRSRLCGDGARSGFGRRLRAVSAQLDNSTEEMIRHSHRSNACLPQKTCQNRFRRELMEWTRA